MPSRYPLANPAPGPRASALRPKVSPYPGLAPFSTDEYPYFFGRTGEAKMLMANMFASRFTVVYGPSGVGKSSLLNAGLLPKLREQDDVVSLSFRNWLGNPGKQLHRAVRQRARKLSTPIELTGDTLVDSCRQLAEESGCYQMLVLDQFEEYFLYHASDSPFDHELANLVSDETLPVRVLVSIREDSVARLDRFDGLIRNLFDNVLRIEHLSRASGQEAIEKPLARYSQESGRSWSIEPALVEQVLDGVQAGHIVLSPGGGGTVKPVTGDSDRIESAYLQLIMERLWTIESERGSSVLRAGTLAALGGVERAVRSRFTELMETFGEEEQDLAAGLFYYLVTPSKSKIAWNVPDLAYYANTDLEPTQALLAKLAEPAYRVLRTSETLTETGNEVVYEIYHDILARAVVEWQEYFQTSKTSLSDAQLRRLADLRNRLEFFEREAADGTEESRRVWYPLLLSLATEAQPLDPELAQYARDAAARVANTTDAAKAGRSASVIERRQVKLLEDEVGLVLKAGVPVTQLAGLYAPRLETYLRSPDADVRRDAESLAGKLGEYPPVEPSMGANAPPRSSAFPGSVAADGATADAYATSAPSYRTGAPSSPDPNVGYGQARGADSRVSTPLPKRGDFYGFLAVVPALNVLPLAVVHLIFRHTIPGYKTIDSNAIWAGIAVVAAVWTVWQLYSVVDNQLRGVRVIAEPFAPWADGVGAFERLAGWPAHELIPVAVGLAAAELANLAGVEPAWVFFPVVALGTLIEIGMYVDAELLIWNSHRLREAFGLGPRSF